MLPEKYPIPDNACEDKGNQCRVDISVDGGMANVSLTLTMSPLDKGKLMVAGVLGRYSINVNGRDLNIEGNALQPKVAKEVKSLYIALADELDSSIFQFQVTGGDRYKGVDGQVYSSTNDSLIGKSGPAHIRGSAVDLRIKYNDGKLVPVDLVRRSLNKTNLIFDPAAMLHHYTDLHYHLQLPKGFKP